MGVEEGHRRSWSRSSGPNNKVTLATAMFISGDMFIFNQ